jgi:hypothetical protein
MFNELAPFVYLNIQSQLYEDTNTRINELYTLFVDHTYMFWLPSPTILRVYSIKELYVVNQSKI